MPSNRKFVFGNNEYYHVFNRGVEKRPTFTNKHEYLRAIATFNYYKYSGLSLRYSKYITLDKNKRLNFLNRLIEDNLQISLLAYCIMENHFHFLIKQIKDNGVVKFMAKFTNSYTKYFNTKHKRVGPLFQGVFKAVHIDSDEQLIHLSRYIHLNPVVGYRVKIEDLSNYQWSSFPSYMGMLDIFQIDKQEIMSFFKNVQDYRKFICDQADFAKQFESIEHLVID